MPGLSAPLQEIIFHPWCHELSHSCGVNEARYTATLAIVRRCWEELRDELLERWIAARPGTRPWAWWQFDAHEPRRLLPGSPGFSLDPVPPDCVSFGMVHCSCRAEEFDNEYESEWAYLERLDLLAPAG